MQFKLKHEDGVALAVLQDLAGSLPAGTCGGKLINTKLWQDTILPFFRDSERIGADFDIWGGASDRDVQLHVEVSHAGAYTVTARLWAETMDGEWKLSGDRAEFETKARDFLASATFANSFMKVMDEFARAFGERPADDRRAP